MHDRLRKTSRSALLIAPLIAPLCVVAAPATAQSLALSYKLDVKADSVQQGIAAVHRCTGLSWLTSLGACGRDLLTRITPATRPQAEDAQNVAIFSMLLPSGPEAGAGAGAPSKMPDAPAAVELPTLGTPSPEPARLRSAGGKDALLGNAKTVDLMFRFGSKYRLRSAEEGWEWYRFTDVAHDNRLKTSGLKALGVELLVPFQ